MSLFNSTALLVHVFRDLVEKLVAVRSQPWCDWGITYMQLTCVFVLDKVNDGDNIIDAKFTENTHKLSETVLTLVLYDTGYKTAT